MNIREFIYFQGYLGLYRKIGVHLFHRSTPAKSAKKNTPQRKDGIEWNTQFYYNYNRKAEAPIVVLARVGRWDNKSTEEESR